MDVGGGSKEETDIFFHCVLAHACFKNYFTEDKVPFSCVTHGNQKILSTEIILNIDESHEHPQY